MNLSASEENYIKSIYHLQLTSHTVNTNALAKQLNTKAASVTDMLKKLQSKKLLEYERYRGFKLNASGNKIALNIVRRHRLWRNRRRRPKPTAPPSPTAPPPHVCRVTSGVATAPCRIGNCTVSCRQLHSVVSAIAQCRVGHCSVSCRP